MSAPTQGEIWWAEAEEKRRPVLIVTRSETIDVLTSVVVAPVTRTIRGIPTEVPVGPHHGLRQDCVANFDTLQSVRRSTLTNRIGALDDGEREGICAALRALADC